MLTIILSKKKKTGNERDREIDRTIERNEKQKKSVYLNSFLSTLLVLIGTTDNRTEIITTNNYHF